MMIPWLSVSVVLRENSALALTSQVVDATIADLPATSLQMPLVACTNDGPPGGARGGAGGYGGGHGGLGGGGGDNIGGGGGGAINQHRQLEVPSQSTVDELFALKMMCLSSW